MKRADKAGGLSTGFIKKKWKARPPKPIPKISDQDTYRVNAILLNKNTFRITEVNNGNGKYKKEERKRACIAEATVVLILICLFLFPLVPFGVVLCISFLSKTLKL